MDTVYSCIHSSFVRLVDNNTIAVNVLDSIYSVKTGAFMLRVANIDNLAPILVEYLYFSRYYTDDLAHKPPTL